MNTPSEKDYPVMQVTLHYRESAYKRKQDSFEKMKGTFFERETTYDVLSKVEDGTYELKYGQFVVDLPSHHYEEMYGTLEIKGDSVPVYSPNGRLYRHVQKGQTFHVYYIKVDSVSHTIRYYIDKEKREVITSKSDVALLNGKHETMMNLKFIG